MIAAVLITAIDFEQTLGRFAVAFLLLVADGGKAKRNIERKNGLASAAGGEATRGLLNQDMIDPINLGSQIRGRSGAGAIAVP